MKLFISLIVGGVLFFLATQLFAKERNTVYCISDDVKGWIIILYEIPNGANPNANNELSIIPIHSKKVIKLSSKMDSDWFKGYFLWGERILLDNPDDKNNLIWGRENGTISKAGKNLTYEILFLGTRKEYELDKLGYESRLEKLLEE